MDREAAMRVVDSVMRAWEWAPEPDTLETWVSAVESLSDSEAAELAVVELFKGSPRRPTFADFRDHYIAVKRRFADEDAAKAEAPALEGTVPSDDVIANAPPVVREVLARLKAQGFRGAALAKAMLAEVVGRSAEPTVGGDSAFGRVCERHRRWVGRHQIDDPCWAHVWRELDPEAERSEARR